MHKFSTILFIIIITISFGCAKKSMPNGIPHWDYEVDFPKELQDDKDKMLLEEMKKNGTMISILMAGSQTPEALKATHQEIELTPTDLNLAITTALTQSTTEKTQSIITTSNHHDNGSDSTSANHGEKRWSIAESSEGQITTDWNHITGKTAGLLWWKKEYQTEVRHIIEIKRSYHSPNCATFSIETEVRERPNQNYKWESGDPELGRESFENLKELLLNSVQKSLKVRRVRIK